MVAFEFDGVNFVVNPLCPGEKAGPLSPPTTKMGMRSIDGGVTAFSLEREGQRTRERERERERESPAKPRQTAIGEGRQRAGSNGTPFR